MMLAAVLLFAFAPAAHGEEQDGSPLSVSLERISQGLSRKALQIPLLPLPEVTFRVEVDATWPRETPLDAVRREVAAELGSRRSTSAAGGATQPLIQFDVLPAILATVHTIRDRWRAHVESDVRRHVAQELADFCTANDCSQAEQDQTPRVEGVILP